MHHVLALAAVVAAAAFGCGHASASVILLDGDSDLTAFAPHHSPDDGNHPGGGTHYFTETGDAHHMAWGSATPTAGPYTVKYDFRAIASFTSGSANVITAAQKARAVDAFSLWSAATDVGFGPNLMFIQDAVSPLSQIINVGTGPIGSSLGLGGGVFSHFGATHSITSGGATQSSTRTWDTIIGNGNPAGTFDYFTVAVQEIGHALGLGHTDNIPGRDMMDGFYSVEQTVLSVSDVAHIRSIYGVGAGTTSAPEPGSMVLLAIGLVGFAGYSRCKRRRTRQCEAR